MKMHSLAMGAALVVGACLARAQSPAVFGEGAACVAGVCSSGQGTVRGVDGTEYTGRWNGGRYVDDVYQVRYAGLPDKTFAVTMSAASQRPLEGTFVRGKVSDTLYGYSTFTGRMATVFSPFANAELSTYASGQYVSNTGVIYDGEFQYIPVRLYKSNIVYGVFVFMGARIDKDADEVRQGLFISDPFGSGANIFFRRARPDYVAQLQSEYAMQQSEAAVDKAGDDSRRAAMGMFMDVLGGLGSLRGMGAGGLGSLGGVGGGKNELARTALGLLSGAMTGQQTPDNAMGNLLGAVQGGIGAGKLGGLPGLGGGDLKSALREAAKQAVRMSVKDYMESQAKPQ